MAERAGRRRSVLTDSLLVHPCCFRSLGEQVAASGRPEEPADNVVEATDRALREVEAATREVKMTGFCLRRTEAVRELDGVKASLAHLVQSSRLGIREDDAVQFAPVRHARWLRRPEDIAFVADGAGLRSLTNKALDHAPGGSRVDPVGTVRGDLVTSCDQP